MQNKGGGEFVAYSKVHKIGSIKTRGQSVGILMVSLVLHKVVIKVWMDPGTITRVGTLIVATIYLQLIQNRYMFRKFYSPSM